MTPPGSTRSTSSAWALLRLAMAIAGVAAIFFVFGLGDLFLVIVAIVAMVIVHEAGHFFTAKWSKMAVTEFFVGFGPRVWSIRLGETEYGVKAIPAGGYVKIPGMTNLEEVDPAQEERTYRRKPFHSRILVGCAGSFMHLVMAFILAWATLVFVGATSATQTEIVGFSGFSPATSPAQHAGLKRGDVIVGVNGHRLSSLEGLKSVIESSAGRPLRLDVERGGKTRSVAVVPQLVRHQVDGHEHTSVLIGVELGTVDQPESAFGALGGAGVVVGQTTRDTVLGVGQVFSPSGISKYVHEVANPQSAPTSVNSGRPESIIGAVRTAVEGAQAGPGYLMEVLIALNIVVGLVNLFPMLPLDGGHVVIALYERIRTRPGRRYYQADAAKMAPFAYAFIVLLGLLVVSTAYLDIAHPIANPFG
ncbi:MAG: M50 family metallopeptidase [Acidimicrobiales bacterium]